jgi:lipopolysaccharide/colanic/teichoic acid biosynthesis glycosyltransferase
MRLHAAGSGPSVTTANDERLTALGRLLRRTKLDELPQLLNVARGDMSFVGPRPKVPHHQMYMLRVRPGITGAASLAFRNEEYMLHGIPPEGLDDLQVKVLMPKKRELDEAYMRTASLYSDLKLIFRTVSGRAAAPEREFPVETHELEKFRRSSGALATRWHDGRLAAAQIEAAEELRVA